MVNTAYVELVKFDKQNSCLGVHRRLRLYVETYGCYNLDYYIAKLSHEIYNRRGITGHAARQKIRANLIKYASFRKVNNNNRFPTQSTTDIKPLRYNPDTNQWEGMEN